MINIGNKNMPEMAQGKFIAGNFETVGEQGLIFIHLPKNDCFVENEYKDVKYRRRFVSIGSIYSEVGFFVSQHYKPWEATGDSVVDAKYSKYSQLALKTVDVDNALISYGLAANYVGWFFDDYKNVKEPTDFPNSETF